ncbi:MAG: hypothetical protein H6744_18785 [Deltaproteobacteria bacterium]|nr:hypothetical protein [Deltaproteobacteria bacterium]
MSVPEPGAEALLARLDDIAASLRRIADALEGRGEAAASAGVTAAAAGPSGGPRRSAAKAPSVAAVAGEAARAAAAAAASAPRRAAPPAAPAGAEGASADVDAGTDEDGPEDTAAMRDTRPILTAMFGAATLDETEDAWEALRALTHPDELVAPRALAGFKAFSWPKLRRNVGLYLSDPEVPSSFRIGRTVPADPSPEQDRIKVFLLRHDQMLVPVSLRRDADDGDAWKLSAVSL